MRLPDARHIKALIGAPCLVQRDRAGRGLFVSDYPRRLKQDEAQTAARRLHDAGFDIRALADDMALIDWTDAQCLAYYAALPTLPLPPLKAAANPALWGLCRLLMQHEAPLAQQDINVLRRALRLLAPADQARLQYLLETSLADALRERRPPPCHAARLLIASGAV